MQVAIVTFEQFNEIDSFVALSILNRLSGRGVRAELCAPTQSVTSMNGVCLQKVRPLEFASEADAVCQTRLDHENRRQLFGSIPSTIETERIVNRAMPRS